MKNQLTSQRLQVNAGIMAWYVKKLTKMTQAMTKECREELARIYKKGYPQIAFDNEVGACANGGEEPRLIGTTKHEVGAKGGSDELSTVSTTDGKSGAAAEVLNFGISTTNENVSNNKNVIYSDNLLMN